MILLHPRSTLTDSLFPHSTLFLSIIVIILSICSMLAVYSSVGTLAYKNSKGSEVYLIKHTSMIVGGFALMYFSHLLDYTYYAGISKILMIEIGRAHV